MNKPCPHCRAPDAGDGKFCLHCGMPLPASTTALDDAPSDRLDIPSASEHADLIVPQPGELAPPPSIPPPVAAMGATSTSPGSIWGPFAGYGTRGRHVAWLMDDLGKRAEDLRTVVSERFQRRTIPGATVEPRILSARGVAVEQRPYYLVSRGRATAGLYVARFGQDLYISQVSYFKGKISPARIFLVLAMVAFGFLYPAILSSAADNIRLGSNGFLPTITGLDSFVAMLCCLGPLYVGVWLALGLMVLFAVYKFLTEKDLLAPVRVQPNEFDQDDLIALEKAVEQTVRESLDVVGIEQDLMPPAEEYGIRQRII